MQEIIEEDLGDGFIVCRSRQHTFGTDAFLLAWFSRPRPREIACDLGTGCGIIPMLWAKAATPSEIWGVEIQADAAEQFERSIACSKPACRIVPVCADLRSLPGGMPFGKFHTVSCNPPYFAGDTGAQSRSTAGKLARHEVSCRIGDACAAAKKLLRFGGRFSVCMRPSRLADTICAMREYQIEPKRIRFVCRESGQAPWLFLMEGRKGARPSIRVEPAFCLYREGKPTPEFLEVYR